MAYSLASRIVTSISRRARIFSSRSPIKLALPMLSHSPPVSIPRLGTPRLVLREYREDDFDAFAAHCADPEATVRHAPWNRCQASHVGAA